MSREWKNVQDSLFFVTILTLLLGLINITFVLAGLLCFTLPFYFYFRYNRQKIWCRYICPRSGMFTRLVSKVNIGLKTPKWLTGKKAKRFVVSYFIFYMTFVTFTTTVVALGYRDPIEQFRFLMVFRMPDLPQLITITAPEWVLHLSYRIFSMIFSSTVIGVTLGILFKPKTWCAICPVNTLTPVKKKAVAVKNVA